MQSALKSLALFALALVVSMVYGSLYIKKENSLFAPFEVGVGSFLFWDLTGNAVLDPAFVRLTSDEPVQQGGIWNTLPQVGNEFEVQVQFRIQGKGAFLNGNGIALWYVRDPGETGPVFGYKDYFTGLGIFIDTHENLADPMKPPHPFIYAMVNNGTIHYADEEDGMYTQIGGCHANVRNVNFITRIAFSYTGTILTVYVDAEGINQWKPCFSVAGVHLPSGYYVGVTSSTGEYSDNHDIFYITTLNVEIPPGVVLEDRSGVIPHVDNFQIPQKYHKDYIEKQEKQKKEEKKREEQIEEMIEKIQQKEHTVQEEKPIVLASFTRKVIYGIGTAIILMIAISLCRKYQAQRHERMQKRLY